MEAVIEREHFERGEPLVYDELLEMPDDTWVWIVYVAPSHKRGRDFEGAYQTRKLKDGGWFLDDGSIFACDFYPDARGSAPCVQVDGEGGVRRLFHAVRKEG